jgi:phosphate starvation-inducible protein PhoH
MPRFAPESDPRPSDVKATSEVEIDDTTVLYGLTGARGDRLRALERELGIECGLRGNTIFLRGGAEPVALAERFLSEAAALLRQGVQLGADDVARALHVLRTEPQLRLRRLRPGGPARLRTQADRAEGPVPEEVRRVDTRA